MSEPYTMLPNWLIDAMPDLSGAEMLGTFGWREKIHPKVPNI